MSGNDYLITEKPMKAIFIFAIPIIIGNLFQQAYNMVDSAVVGRYVSEEALAAVGDCSALTFIYIGIAIGAGIGSSVIVSRHFGEKDLIRMKTAFYTAFFVFLAVSFVIAILSFLLGRPLMRLLNTPENILDMVMVYLNIYLLGLPFLFMYNMVSFMFNALGNSRTPLYFLIFSSLLNIVLDIWMVRSLHMGIAGVAWATLIAQGLSAILSFLFLLDTMKNLCPQKAALFDRRELKEIIRIALPSIFQQCTVSIGMLLVQSVVNSLGSQVLAGFSVSSRIENVCIVPMTSISNALSSYTAQNLGASKSERVSRGLLSALGLVLVFALVSLLLCSLFNQQLTALFLSAGASETAFSTAASYIRFIGFFFVLIGIKMAFDGILRGSGDVGMFTLANLANLALRVVISFTLGPVYGMSAIMMAVPAGWAINGIISGLEYRTGKWKKAYISPARHSR